MTPYNKPEWKLRLEKILENAAEKQAKNAIVTGDGDPEPDVIYVENTGSLFQGKRLLNALRTRAAPKKPIQPFQHNDEVDSDDEIIFEIFGPEEKDARLKDLPDVSQSFEARKAPKTAIDEEMKDLSNQANGLKRTT